MFNHVLLLLINYNYMHDISKLIHAIVNFSFTLNVQFNVIS